MGDSLAGDGRLSTPKRIAGMRTKTGLAVSALIALAMAAVLYLMGRLPICACGEVKLWHGVVFSSENSQHLTDWYTPSHVIHGIVFYALGWLVFRRATLGFRLVAATLLEAGWEVLENTDWIINRYREATIALDYFGDSIINSTADVLAMVLGFFLAARLPVWASIAVAVVLEAFTMYFIRDGLALNIVMLLWPLDAVLRWQNGG
ncbi:MAG: DUF2585 domain-containing protein [Rhodobiaceae bacterium]|nr:DUF2585 domain-containing protein [Rhodobiaceae bacterium]